MYFSSAFVLAALPFLVGAVPAQKSARDVLSIPLSKRSTLPNADGVVDVQNLQANIHHTTAKFEKGFETYKKNTGEAHPLASKAGHPKRGGAVAVSLSDDQNGMWYGNILVGTPATQYTVGFDTGSAALFLPGPSCPTCVGHNIYHPTLSSTAKDLGKKSTSEYGDGQVTGELFTDDVFVGGLEATGQTLLAASIYSSSFEYQNFPADGLMGMGFKEISPFNAASFFETLVAQDRLQEQVFGFYLAGSGSELIIGGRNGNLYSGNLTYVGVTKRGYWQTTFNGISVNGKAIPIGTQNAVIDTGTTLLLGDPESILSIYEQIPGSGQLQNTNLYTIPCNTNAIVSLTLGGTRFNISPSTYNLGHITASTCLGGFGPISANFGFWVIGDVFLRNVYTEFDYGNLRVGFAQLAA